MGLDDTAGNQKWIAAALSLFLSACNGHLPPAPTEVRVPVMVSCLTRDQLPKSPTVMSNQELATLDDYFLVIQLASERIALNQFSKEQTALLQACVK